ELVAAEAINHIHYMGRHVGKAKQIASKMIQVDSGKESFPENFYKYY
uniref:Potassium channel domain-containing protein n=1 Tax=Parascaris univalens TaxID=6257 RepID=A0A915BCE6_PARUN